MKDILKIVFVFAIGAVIVITSLNGCSNAIKTNEVEPFDSITVEKIDLRHYYKTNNGDTTYYREHVYAYKFKYSGHHYISFRSTGSRCGVVHDPDCPCHNKN